MFLHYTKQGLLHVTAVYPRIFYILHFFGRIHQRSVSLVKSILCLWKSFCNVNVFIINNEISEKVTIDHTQQINSPVLLKTRSISTSFGRKKSTFFIDYDALIRNWNQENDSYLKKKTVVSTHVHSDNVLNRTIQIDTLDRQLQTLNNVLSESAKHGVNIRTRN